MQMPFRRTTKKLFLYVVVVVVFISLTLVAAYAGTLHYIGTDRMEIHIG
ncbi:MAG: hypothetical protein LC803_14790 [Acidobacteria bacterium]|nr:hypothetical protein [Acidobacteriota bacterium]